MDKYLTDRAFAVILILVVTVLGWFGKDTVALSIGGTGAVVLAFKWLIEIYL